MKKIFKLTIMEYSTSELNSINKKCTEIDAYFDNKIYNCVGCIYNKEWESSNRSDIPCGQQNCWHKVSYDNINDELYYRKQELLEYIEELTA